MLAHPTEVHAFEAERLRLLAEFYYQKALVQKETSKRKACQDYAKEYYHQALAYSTKQCANAYSLRILVGLCRLLPRQEGGEARTRLLDTYTLFTEGHDTLDLQEAKQTIELFARKK